MKDTESEISDGVGVVLATNDEESEVGIGVEKVCNEVARVIVTKDLELTICVCDSRREAVDNLRCVVFSGSWVEAVAFVGLFTGPVNR